MKVTGFSFIKNAVRFDYPVVEAIKSVLPICDDFVIAVGESDDGTVQLIESIDSSKIRIIPTVWDESLMEGGQVLAVETDKALSEIPEDSDWAFYIQGDEVLHEDFLDPVVKAMKQYKDDSSVDGLLFKYLHFYGSYDYVGVSSNWYKNEIRVIKNGRGIYSYRDAQGFRKGDDKKLSVKSTDACIYHYGWVREPKAMLEKRASFVKLYRGEEAAEATFIEGDSYEYEKNVTELKPFQGSHPEVMKERIGRKNWKFDCDISFRRKSPKDRAKKIIYKLFRVDLNYRNYKIISMVLLGWMILSYTGMAQQNPKNLEIDWKTDTTKRVAPLEEFTALLMPDGIPPIDEPGFWNIHKAALAFFEHEPLIVIEINGEAKGYPLSILTYHEIVNDELGGVPITVSYCPLCNAAIVFDRRLSYDGEELLLDFGVSGMLRNSDLVMWDRQTESWWQQFTGTALVGELAGEQLTCLSSMIISLEEFAASYPQGLVLSTNTGHNKNYGTNPYTGYDNLANTRPRLYKGEVDSRLPAMERVIDVQAYGKYKIYPLSLVSSEKVINDTFEGEPLVLFYTSKTVSVLDEADIAESREIGSVTVFRPVIRGELLSFIIGLDGFEDEQTGSLWSITGKCISGKLEGEELRPVVHGNHFAFAWFEFHPESMIYGQ